MSVSATTIGRLRGVEKNEGAWAFPLSAASREGYRPHRTRKQVLPRYEVVTTHIVPAGLSWANASVSEGISLTILEGMAASLPVVATRVGGTPEVVDETCGILVPARDAAALAAAIEQLASDPGRREQLGRAGRSRVARHFTMDRMVGDYARVYEEVG